MGHRLAWSFWGNRAKMHSAPSSHSEHFRQFRKRCPLSRHLTATYLKSVPKTSDFGDIIVTVSPRVVQYTICTTVSGRPALKRSRATLFTLFPYSLFFSFPLPSEPGTRVPFPTRVGEGRRDKDKGRGGRVWQAVEGKGRTHFCSQKPKPKVLAGVEAKGRSAATC